MTPCLGSGSVQLAMNDVLKVEHQGTSTVLTIDRPKALNAINAEVIQALDGALDALPADCRVVVITGGGNKAFVAGADIKAMAGMSAAEGEAFSRAGHDLGAKIAALPQPVIAAVNGYALGGGCELMLACDFAIASDNARFGQPEVGLGVMPGFGGTTRLGRRIGPARARQLLVTGEQLKADEALRIGLVNEVVPQAELMERVMKIAGLIAKNAPRAVALAKRSALIGEETDIATANAFEVANFGLCFATDDLKEGMGAFIEKRAPTWTGR